jgi:hypothetical protein
MKAKHEFRWEKDYYAYLHTILLSNAMHGVITQNLMYTETDEIEERNKPEQVYKRANEYADYFIEKIKNYKQ